VSTVSILEGGQVTAADQVIRPNHPLSVDGMKLYQLRFGMAPRVVVRAGDTVLYDDAVMMADNSGVWTGTAKIKTTEPDQIALDLALLPDFAVDAQGRPFSRSAEPDNPVLFADLWVGELGLNRPVDASRFLRDGEPVASATLLPGDTSDPLVGQELTVEFAELPMWSGLQVSYAPGHRILLAGAALLLVGLISSLYAYRRRVWAEAHVDADGVTTVTIAGVALQRKVVFADAFRALAEDVRSALPAPGDRAAEEVATDAQHG
jgi:cytochrome c biogenesis protein